MFVKLRNQFLIISMITTFVVLFIAFSSIYLITCQKLKSDIRAELQKVYHFYQKSSQNKKAFQEDPTLLHSEPQGHSSSFEIKTNSKWHIIETRSKFDFNNEFFQHVTNEIASRGVTQGSLDFNESRWAYVVYKKESNYLIYSVDVTNQLRIVNTLIYSFIFVGFIILVIIFFTNRFFANRYIAPVKEAFTKQKQFIADASHELKTPLAIISTNTDVLLDNGEDTISNQSKWIHHIQEETSRMKELTNNLLYLTEIDHTQTQMLYVPFNLSETVESVILTMEAIIFEKNISLHYEIEPNLNIQGNEEQIKQVIMILLDNAIKYNHLMGSLVLRLRKQNSDVVLSVQNTGDGISSEHLDKIFDRFYRTDSSRSRKLGGYGLGLAIAKSIIEQHKGKIYAKSTLNETTTFYVHFSYLFPKGSIKR